MALFENLFKKKICDCCGGEIGLLGNRKLEDGNLCKHCAAKLSPWFSDRRSSTVAEIAEQLAYREANQEKVAAFAVTRVLGEHVRVLLDDNAQQFMVTSARDLAEDNPDVLAFSDMTTCEAQITDREEEILRTDEQDQEVSYDPPRYKYYYDFFLTIHVRNPYFDEIRFKLNNATVQVESPEPPAPKAVRTAALRPGVRKPIAPPPAEKFDPEQDKEYLRYEEMLSQVYETLMDICQPDRPKAGATEGPTILCPHCGATLPAAAYFCERCGGTIQR